MLQKRLERIQELFTADIWQRPGFCDVSGSLDVSHAFCTSQDDAVVFA